MVAPWVGRGNINAAIMVSLLRELIPPGNNVGIGVGRGNNAGTTMAF